MGRINRKSRDEDGLFTLENEKDTHRDWVNENVSRASVWLLLLALSAILISAL